MSTIAVKPRRGTIAMQLDKRGSTVFDVDKDELFDIVSKSEEQLTRSDFDKLHAVIAEQAKKEIDDKNAATKQAAQAGKRAKLLGVVVAVLVLFLGLSLAGTLGITYVVVDKQVQTTTGTTGVLAAKGTNEVAKTATAMTSLPLYLAPAMSMEQLSRINSVAVTLNDDLIGEHQVLLKITETRKINDTAIIFFTESPTRTITIWNGDAYVRDAPADSTSTANAVFYPICKADASCSAVHVDEAEDAEALNAKALEALASIGLSCNNGGTTHSGRRMPTCSLDATVTNDGCGPPSFCEYEAVASYMCTFGWMGLNSPMARAFARVPISYGGPT